ncbi:hypothetical protein NKG05_25850 [Oerskovia sp. M15]
MTATIDARLLAVYLNDHVAGATVGVNRVRRMARLRRHRGRDGDQAPGDPARGGTRVADRVPAPTRDPGPEVQGRRRLGG